MEKIILILVDGMRPDALSLCQNRYAEQFLSDHTYLSGAETVMPSLTLPCHMSLFHSVPPQRHGTTTNVYTPQPRPVRGLFEVLSGAGVSCASFYNWEELRDLSRPGSLSYSEYRVLKLEEEPDMTLTGSAVRYIEKNNPGFVFLYLGASDIAGHTYGWMSQEYLNTVSRAWDCIRMVEENCGQYRLLITADHGGHDFMHGADIPEDMTIPIIISGKHSLSEKAKTAQITDIAPTVTHFFGMDPDKEWRGESLIR